MSDESEKPAKAVTPPPANTPASPAGRFARRPVSFRRWASLTLTLALTFVVVGIAPMSLALRIFGPASVAGLPGLPLPFVPLATPTLTGTLADLAVPQQAWTADTVVVSRGAATRMPLATLDAGFPVTIVGAARVGGARWDSITWRGPTRNSGGAGWVPHTALTVAAANGTAEADPAALSSALAAALAPFGSRAGIVVYYPDAHQIYTSGADVAYPLGDGMRGILLTDLLASSLARQPTLGGQPPQQVVQGVASGDPSALSVVYAQLGGSAQLTAFLAGLDVDGVTLDPLSWSACGATPRALAEYYAALAGITLPADNTTITEAIRTEALAALAPNAQMAALAGFGTPLPPSASVLLVTGSAQAADGWTMNAAGVIIAPSGLRYVVALSVRAQPSSDAAHTAIGDLLRQVAAVALA